MNRKENTRYIYGKNPVREKIKSIKSGVLFINKNCKISNFQDIIDKAKSKNFQITLTDPNSFKKFFGDIKDNIVLKIDEEYNNNITEDDFLNELNTKPDKSIILILDGITDVGNFGAILRSALLFNVDTVILPKNNSCPITETVEKRSAGAVFNIKTVYVTNLVRIINILKENGYWIYAASMEGESIDKTSFNEKSVVIMGSEGKGIRDLVKKNSDVIVKIPTNEKLDSLNVSVSTGIILYEMNKKLNQ